MVLVVLKFEMLSAPELSLSFKRDTQAVEAISNKS